MKKRLEEFVRDNREAFDDKVPGDKTWTGIEAALPGSKKSPWNSLMIWRAAAILFMGLSIYLMIPKESEITTHSAKIAMNEFQDVEAFYVQEISEKVRMIDNYSSAEGLNGFTQDIRQLEAMYAVLKEEMEASPSQKVRDALVLNLLIRIDLLNQQLHKLDTEFREKEEADENSKEAST